MAGISVNGSGAYNDLSVQERALINYYRNKHNASVSPYYSGNNGMQNPQPAASGAQPGGWDISEYNETCTDGANDGKIGTLGAAWNLVKGAVKTVGGAVSGLCSVQGILTAGVLGAASIICPPVGLALCTYGAVKGGAQALGGLIDAAKNGGTDAQKKAAWQNLGAGVFTGVLSAFGIKAGFGAMKNAASLSDKGSALAELSKNGGKLFSKDGLSAFIKDAQASTAHNWDAVKLGFRNLFKKKEAAATPASEAQTAPVPAAPAEAAPEKLGIWGRIRKFFSRKNNTETPASAPAPAAPAPAPAAPAPAAPAQTPAPGAAADAAKAVADANAGNLEILNVSLKNAEARVGALKLAKAPEAEIALAEGAVKLLKAQIKELNPSMARQALNYLKNDSPRLSNYGYNSILQLAEMLTPEIIAETNT